MKRVPFVGPTNIRRHLTKFSRHGGLAPGICTYLIYTGHFIMFCMITNIYNKKTKGPTLIQLFTATGKLKKFF
jgi:hypothetical protein